MPARAPEHEFGRRLLAESIELQRRYAASGPPPPEEPTYHPALRVLSVIATVLALAALVLLLPLAVPAHS